MAARPATGAHSAGHEQATGTFPVDVGMVAVPLPDPDGPLGALSVLVEAPGGPDSARPAFLERLASALGATFRPRTRAIRIEGLPDGVRVHTADGGSVTAWVRP